MPEHRPRPSAVATFPGETSFARSSSLTQHAARFEVWFEPDNGDPERKLAERIYKIEGWQR